MIPLPRKKPSYYRTYCDRMTIRREFEEFVVLIAKELGDSDQAPRLCHALRRYATTHCRLAENACNHGLSPREEREDERTEKRITELCQPHGIKPIFQGDPRGATVKLQVPSGRTNDWGQIGICVPTSR